MSIALTHATVIDATGSPAQPDRTVLVRDGRIAVVGRSSEVEVPADAEILDGSGKFVIPGLADMHVHTDDNENVYLPLYLVNGITTTRQMAGQPYLHEWRRRIAEGTLLGPRLSIGSKLVEGDPGLWDGFPPETRAQLTHTAADPDAARRIVRTVHEEGADFVKVYSRLHRDVYFALVDEAQRVGIPVAGHTPDEVPVTEVAAAGQVSIEHVHALFPATSKNDAAHLAALARMNVGSGAYAEWFHQVNEIEWAAAHTYSPFTAEKVFQRLVAHGTAYTPTLTMHRILDQPHLGSLGDDRLRYLPADLRGTWEWVHDNAYALGRTPEEAFRRSVLYQRRLAVTKAMADAGVRLLAGTDNPAVFGFHGFDLHQELELFVTAGLTPMQALQTATREPARFLGVADTAGTVQEGRNADLVVLDANPLADIRNTTRIHAVVVAGRLIDAAERTRMLAAIEAAASGMPDRPRTATGCR